MYELARRSRQGEPQGRGYDICAPATAETRIDAELEHAWES
jgi:hypothetical protein